MTTLQLFSVIDIAALIAGLAIYLFIVGRQLAAVAVKLEELSPGCSWRLMRDYGNVFDTFRNQFETAAAPSRWRPTYESA